MERDKKKRKNIQDSDYSDNNIHVNINVGKSDNHKDQDNSIVNDITEVKEVKEKLIDDKKKIDNTDSLLANLKTLIKRFNQKKEELINRRIDIPNDVFNLPDIEINSPEDIIRLSDIIRDKIIQLNNILTNTKREPPKSIQLPRNPNIFQTNMRNDFPSNTSNPFKPFPTNTRTPPAGDQVVPPVAPPANSSGLTPAQEEKERNLLMFLEEEFGKYRQFYFDNKNTTDVSKLRRVIQIQEDEIVRLQKIKNDLFLQANRDKVDEIINSVQGNKSDTNIALQNLLDIKPDDDDGGDESDLPSDPPAFEEPDADPDLLNRRNTLLLYKSRMNNTGRSPNGFLIVGRELDQNLEFINNAIQKEDQLTQPEKDYVLSLYNIMDNSSGLFEPAKAYRNINSRVLDKNDVLTLQILDPTQPDKFNLILNGNVEIVDNANSQPVKFDSNGDIYFEGNSIDEPPGVVEDPGVDPTGGGRRPGENSPDTLPEEEFRDDDRVQPSWGHWYDGFFGMGRDGEYEDGLYHDGL